MRLIQITAVVAFTLAVGSAHGTTWYVDAANPCPGSGTLADPFCTIQQGLTAADPAGGDFVEVANGTYLRPGDVNLDFWGRATVLYSASGDPSLCIIDGGGANRAIHFNAGTRATQVSGFRMTNCYGAAVRCDYSSPTIENCIFDDNTAASGGAVYLAKSAPLFTGCDFFENSAAVDGGAVYAAGSDAEFVNCDFYSGTQGNSAPSGGGLYAVSCPNLSLTNCRFNYNTASTDGGALYIDNHCNPSLANCSFELNSAAGDGGACFIDRSSDPTFSTCTFSENTAGDDGGAIYNRDGSHMVFNDCDFTSNVAPSGGGAIKNEAASCEITGGEFDDNEATANRGGALRNIDGSSAVITDAVFTDNRAGQGGGAVHNQQSTLETSGCSFWTNVAGTNGGAIRSTGATSTAEVTSCDFTGNRATLNGGAIANADDSDVTVTGGNFTQNVATDPNSMGGGLASESATATVSGARLEGNAAANGGGIANLSGSVTVSGCEFIGNTASQAGAGLLTDGGDATVSGSTFTDNIAAYAGGGLFSFDSPSVTVEDSTFTHNWATGTPSFGGAIRIELGTLSLARCGFYEWNEALSAGGALSTKGASVSAEDCDFGRDLVGNTAGLGGGAHHEGPGPDRAEYKRCRFVANIASTAGGGGVALVDHHATLHNCAFFNNDSFGTGGAIDAFATTMTSLELANCLFSGNTTDIAGGALRVSNNAAITTATIANGTFYGNVATDKTWGEGGGVWVGGAGPSNVAVDNTIFSQNQDALGNVFSAQIFRQGVSPCVVALAYCCFDPGACPTVPCPGCICANPLLGGDLRLLAGSPCIDAANNTALPPDSMDLDCDSDTSEPIPLDLDDIRRLTDHHLPIVDMGAYEVGLLGDVDGDCYVGLSDLGELLAHYGDCGVGYDHGDIVNPEGDCCVLLSDLGALLANYGMTCP